MTDSPASINSDAPQPTESKKMEEDSNQGELVGLGGWLMLFIVGLIYGIVSTIPSVAELDRLDYHNALGVMRAVAIVSTLGGSLIALILIFTKSRICPKFVVSFLIFVIFTNLTAVAILKSQAGENLTAKLAIAASTLKAVAWLLYFLSSKRVKNTFGGLSTPAAADG